MTSDSYIHIPATISKVAAARMRLYPDPHGLPSMPPPTDREAWRDMQAMVEKFTLEAQEPVIEALKPRVTPRSVDGVAVLDVKPENWNDSGRVLVYIHGGGFTLLSAASTLATAALLASATGLRVVSIDYTLAPHADWQQVQEEVATVFKGLSSLGYRARHIAVAGDSAGGAIAASAVLKMRDHGAAMPAAVVLWSPWSDVTNRGDSYHTLQSAEALYTYEGFLKPSADAYAKPDYQAHPYVSPVYGQYGHGFPPTLIQGGTKEIFLSNFVRLYQAMDQADQVVKLDLYEGMTHVFQSAIPDSPESQIALEKVAEFLGKHWSI